MLESVLCERRVLLCRCCRLSSDSRFDETEEELKDRDSKYSTGLGLISMGNGHCTKLAS